MNLQFSGTCNLIAAVNIGIRAVLEETAGAGVPAAWEANAESRIAAPERHALIKAVYTRAGLFCAQLLPDRDTPAIPARLRRTGFVNTPAISRSDCRDERWHQTLSGRRPSRLDLAASLDGRSNAARLSAGSPLIRCAPPVYKSRDIKAPSAVITL